MPLPVWGNTQVDGRDGLGVAWAGYGTCGGTARGLPAGALGLPLGQLGLRRGFGRLGSGLRLQDGLGLPELGEAALAVGQLGRQLVAPPALAVLGVLRRIDLFCLREEGGDFLCQPPLGLAYPIHQLLGQPQVIERLAAQLCPALQDLPFCGRGPPESLRAAHLAVGQYPTPFGEG